ncbi:MAG: phosphoribosylamine--glycine ligase [Halobacteriales archaeon]|nr:phosphoribosylamine--glycine ligase [Halobacteriales archaeon]
MTVDETVLLVGGGGREHAIARALADDVDLYAGAGNRNPGIVELAEEFEPLDPSDPAAVADYATEVGATLAVIGPEAPLQAGVADALSDAGVFPFGPTAAQARIETDKAYQRRFMREHAIPGCPDFETFDDLDAAANHIEAAEGDLVVKPAGLTGGKGVQVIGDQVSAAAAAADLREADYDRVVLEERLVGEEFTVQALVANGDLRVTPAVQDHKRAYAGDEGPNTGGMGSYSDAGRALPFLTAAEYDEAVAILEATVDALGDYTGVLYGQFMLTADGVSVIEFNARFGDPEAMNTLPVLETRFVDVLTAARDGDPLPDLAFADRATVCKYAVPAGYPTDPRAGTKLTLDGSSVGDAQLFYGSVEDRPDGLYTTTSRSFAVVGVARTIAGANAIVEAALVDVDEAELRVRHDIGTDELVQSRIDHAEALRRDR